MSCWRPTFSGASSPASSWASLTPTARQAFALYAEIRRRPSGRGYRRRPSPALRALPGCKGKVGALGFCLGGQLAYLAAAAAGVDCAVCYYGVGIEQLLDLRPKIKCPMVLHIRRRRTSSIPPAVVDAIRKAPSRAGQDVEIYVYPGVDHAFARTGGARLRQARGDDGAFALDRALPPGAGAAFRSLALWDLHTLLRVRHARRRRRRWRPWSPSPTSTTCRP